MKSYAAVWAQAYDMAVLQGARPMDAALLANKAVEAVKKGE